jgi:putative spermidine/putrescine transport system substrate-binding protein
VKDWLNCSGSGKGMLYRRATALAAIVIVTLLAAACSRQPEVTTELPSDLDWPAIEAMARGQELRFAMWTGDPAINRYINDFVAPRLREKGIALQVVPGQADIASRLLSEIEAGQAVSQLDLVWINGENFHKLRRMAALAGPFTARLPNNRHIDWDNPLIAKDFQQPVAGYEAPWGTAQLLLIADSARVADPPRTPAALADWIHTHPGRFTFDVGFTGLSFLKSLMYAYAGSPRELDGHFDPTVYARLKAQVFAWVSAVRADLWRGGETFPKDVAQLHQLFANGELDFTISFNDGEVDNKVANGLFPATAQAYALSTGMLANSHYLGVVARSPHQAAALVAINELISPAAQLEKLKPEVWGDGTVLAVARLPEPWPARFAAASARQRAPSRAELTAIARPEPAAELMIRLDQDFRDEILRR